MGDKWVAGLAKKIESWLQEQIEISGAQGFVLGLSGGVDSAVAAALCGRVCPTTTLGIAMPCFSDAEDIEHALLTANTFGITYREVVLDTVFARLVELLTGAPYNPEKTDLATANIKPRIRMAVLYYHAAINQSLVVGTTNRSEYTIGYFTKHGDGGVDLMPLAQVVKKDIWALAKYLGVPEVIIQKPPSAGLWKGQSDENEMGFSYEQLDQYILTGQAPAQIKEVVQRLAGKSRHKKQLPATPPL